jgi:excisionase family DNA binding protein
MDRDDSLRRLKQALGTHREALEEFESALLEFEESIDGEGQERPLREERLGLLAIPEVCQELGMGKSWVYRRLRSGEIPSVKLGRSIKVKREDLEEYLEKHRFRPPVA